MTSTSTSALPPDLSFVHSADDTQWDTSQLATRYTPNILTQIAEILKSTQQEPHDNTHSSCSSSFSFTEYDLKRLLVSLLQMKKGQLKDKQTLDAIQSIISYCQTQQTSDWVRWLAHRMTDFTKHGGLTPYTIGSHSGTSQQREEQDDEDVKMISDILQKLKQTEQATAEKEEKITADPENKTSAARTALPSLDDNEHQLQLLPYEYPFLASSRSSLSTPQHSTPHVRVRCGFSFFDDFSLSSSTMEQRTDAMDLSEIDRNQINHIDNKATAVTSRPNAGAHAHSSASFALQRAAIGAPAHSSAFGRQPSLPLSSSHSTPTRPRLSPSLTNTVPNPASSSSPTVSSTPPSSQSRPSISQPVPLGRPSIAPRIEGKRVIQVLAASDAALLTGSLQQKKQMLQEQKREKREQEKQFQQQQKQKAQEEQRKKKQEKEHEKAEKKRLREEAAKQREEKNKNKKEKHEQQQEVATAQQTQKPQGELSTDSPSSPGGKQKKKRKNEPDQTGAEQDVETERKLSMKKKHKAEGTPAEAERATAPAVTMASSEESVQHPPLPKHQTEETEYTLNTELSQALQAHAASLRLASSAEAHMNTNHDPASDLSASLASELRDALSAAY